MFSNKKLKNLFSNWLIPIIIAILLAIIINKFILYKIVVPSPSMSPTVEVGNQLFVTKVYNTSNIKRGDILVFNSDELHKLLLKRVIGLPDDNVEIKKDGEVYVNGEKIKEDYVKYPGGKTDMHFNVPEGKLLMLGDNRSNSDDARYWDNPYVDITDIDAKAQIIIYPFNKIRFIR